MTTCSDKTQETREAETGIAKIEASMAELLNDLNRMKFALYVLGQNLSSNGDFIEGMKPISANLAMEMADLCLGAAFGKPNEKLDNAFRVWIARGRPWPHHS